MTRVVTVPATYAGVDVWSYATDPPYDVDTTRVTIVGGGAANMFADGSDATYAVLPPQSSPYTVSGAGPRITFPAIDIPDGAYFPGNPSLPGVGWVLNVRGREEAGTWVAPTVFGNIIFAYDGSYTLDPIGFAAELSPDVLTTAWTNWVTYNDYDQPWWSEDAPLPGVGDPNDHIFPRTQAFRDGTAAWVLLNWYSELNAPVHISEVSLTVMWDGGTGSLPALRQVQRDDGRGLGGTPRAVQRFTRQSSIRTLTAPY